MLEENINFKKRNKNGGAPKKNKEDLLNNYNLRLSQKQLNSLRKTYKSLNNPNYKFATFLRDKLLKNEIKYFHIDKSKADIVYHLARIGTNINQIAKHLNQTISNTRLDEEFKNLKNSFEQILYKMYGDKD